jgi:4-hydroxybenzoate polyprenyltransferase
MNKGIKTILIVFSAVIGIVLFSGISTATIMINDVFAEDIDKQKGRNSNSDDGSISTINIIPPPKNDRTNCASNSEQC